MSKRSRFSISDLAAPVTVAFFLRSISSRSSSGVGAFPVALRSSTSAFTASACLAISVSTWSLISAS